MYCFDVSRLAVPINAYVCGDVTETISNSIFMPVLNTPAVHVVGGTPQSGGLYIALPSLSRRCPDGG